MDPVWFQNDWNLLLRQIEVAKNYRLVTSLPEGAIPNPIVDRLLPTSLYIQMAERFDDGLELVVESKRLHVPKKYRQTFGGRVQFLIDRGEFLEPSEVKRIQETRNDAVHEQRFYVEWQALQADLELLHDELHDQGIGEPMPKLEFFFERSAGRPSPDPDIVWEREITFGVMEGQRPMWRATMRELTHKSG